MLTYTPLLCPICAKKPTVLTVQLLYLLPTVVPNLRQETEIVLAQIPLSSQFVARSQNVLTIHTTVVPDIMMFNYYPQSDGYQGKKQPLGLRPFVRQWWWWWGRPVSALCLPRNLSSTPLRALYRLSANISPCVHSKKIFCTSMLM